MLCLMMLIGKECLLSDLHESCIRPGTVRYLGKDLEVKCLVCKEHETYVVARHHGIVTARSPASTPSA